MLQLRIARAMAFMMCSVAAFAGDIMGVPFALAWSPIPTTQDRSDQAFITSRIPRRDFLKNGVIAASSLVPWPSVAKAEEQGVMSTSDVASLLHAVPTFTIVDKKGVPFMVVGEDAKVTGYFFTSYGEAERILRIAKASANKAIKQARAEGKSDEEVGTNPWTMARISSVPLDSAVTLVSKSSASFGGGNYFRLAPTEQDIDDALALTGQDDLAEGKVPLFYYADFTIEVNGEKRSPLYFRKSELESAFRRTNRGSNPPPVLVTELLAVLAEMVKPGGTDNDLKTLIFVPPKESERKRIDCDKAGGNEPSFFIGQRIIVL